MIRILVPMNSTVETQPPTTPNVEAKIATGQNSGDKRAWLLHAVNFSPFFLLLWFVSRFGVNVPQVDEWFLAYLLHAVHFKKATLSDFFALANEHRIAVPRAIWTPLAFATHWNLRVEMMVNLTAPLAIFAVLYWLALRQTGQRGNIVAWLANLSTGLLVFSLAQYGIWLWGLAGGHVIADALFVAAIGVCFVQRLDPWIRLALAAFFCFAASFSQLWGLGSWLALLPCVALLAGRKGNVATFAAWFAAFAATAVLYFYHFHFMQSAGSPLGFLAHPLHSAGFFVAALGTPFCRGGGAEITVPLAFLTGGAVLLALVTCLVLLRSDERRESLAPWFSVALFGLFFAAMVAVGRGNWGYEAAVQSRYAAGTMFVAIATLQLGRMVCADRGRQVYLFLVGALWTLLLLGSAAAIAEAGYLKTDLSHGKLFLEVLRYLDPRTDSDQKGVLFPLYPTEGTGNIRTTGELLNQIGFLHLASDVNFVDPAPAQDGSFESADGSADLLHLRRSKDEVTVSGWASLPGNRGVPKVVLISYGEQKTFITGAVVGWVDRPDVAAMRGDPRYLHSGWKVSFPTKFLPPGEGVLKAWVYDAVEKRFLRLPETGGEKRFRVEEAP
jgi:hypothetical protein